MKGQHSSRHAVNGTILVGISVILMGLVLVGCGESQLRTTALTANRTPVVVDLPTPMHFELVDELSEDYAAPGWRQVKHSYFGQAAPNVVRDFYKEQMPTAGWKFISDQNVQGAFHLLFEKAQELCDIRISKQRRQLKEGAMIAVIIKPVGGEAEQK